jgi:hypothetical protein
MSFIHASVTMLLLAAANSAAEQAPPAFDLYQGPKGIDVSLDPSLQYALPGNNQDCSLEMVGQPGTTFRLIQM